MQLREYFGRQAGRRDALVRHAHDAPPGHLGQQRGGRKRARRTMAARQLARIGLGISDELLLAAGRELGAHHQDETGLADLADRHGVVYRAYGSFLSRLTLVAFLVLVVTSRVWPECNVVSASMQVDALAVFLQVSHSRGDSGQSEPEGTSLQPD